MNKLHVITLVFLLSGALFNNTFAVDNQLKSTSKNQLLNEYNLIGSGLMKVMFWEVYQAEFYVKPPVNQQSFDNVDHNNVFPQALKINYLRDIDKEDLVDATEDQWQHLKMESTKQTQWLKRLMTIFPNIKKGNSITLIVDKNKVSTFYVSDSQSINRKLGIVEDVEFGPAFLAIWLSKDTSRPVLRRKLLGEQ